MPILDRDIPRKSVVAAHGLSEALTCIVTDKLNGRNGR